VSFRVKNIGTAPAAITTLANVSLVSSDPNGFSPYLGSVNRSTTAGLIPVGFDTLITFTAPITSQTSVVPGVFTLKVLADPTFFVPESNETNNTATVPIELRAPATDNLKLLVTNVTGNNRVDPSGVLSVNVTVKNNSTLPSLPDSVSIVSWLASSGLGPGYYYSVPFSLNKVAIPAIAANQSITIPASYTMPATLLSNVYAKPSGAAALLEPYFIVKSVNTDVLNRPPTTTPQAFSFNYPILPNATADLALTGSPINATWDSINRFINVRLRVTNNGPNTANKITVALNRVFARGNNPELPSVIDFTLTSGTGSVERKDVITSQYDNTAIFWGWKIPNLASGASIEATFQGVVRTEFAAPQTITTYYKDLTIKPAILYADAVDNVKTNDTISGGLTVRFVPIVSNALPDLTLANLNTPTPSIGQGQDLIYNVDIINSGGATANGEIGVQSYVSTDNVLSADDLVFGGIGIVDLTAGTQRVQVGGTLTPTNNIPVGQYYLILKVDALGRFQEYNENNNVISVPFTVTLPQPSTNYCVSKGNLPWTEWIANVQFSNINNASQKEGYGNFTNLTANIAQGQTYPLSITRGFSWAADPANATQQGVIWIDFNQNKTFEATEATTFARSATSVNISIPATATLGNTRMRVSLKTIGTPTACEVFDKGEVEDYSVNIAAGTGGGTPKLVISNVTGPTSALPGSQITLVVTVTNTGTAPTVATKMQYTQNEYANGYTAPLTNDFLTIAPLAPNETRVINYTLTLINPIYPANSTYLRGSRDFRPFNFGSYYVQATNGNSATDQAPFYTEAKFEFNIPMTFPSANISVNVVPNKTSLAVGETWSAIYSIKNNSTITVKQVFVNLGSFAKFNLNQSLGSYALTGSRNLSPNSTMRYGSGENTETGLEVFDLAAGETRSVTLDFSTPLTSNTTPSSTFLYFPVVNVFSNVINTNTTVNAPITINYNAPPQNLPDLTISNLVVPSSTVQVGAGRVLGFRFDVGNNSTVNVPNFFRIKSYFSTDQVLSADDLVRGDFSTGNYNAGFSVNVGNSVDATIPEGQYYLIVKIDADNEIAESNEGNNTVVSQLLTMTSSTGGGGADIALSLTTTPSVYRAYTAQNFRISAVNSGTTAFTNVKIKFTKPANTVAGGTKVASIGTFNDYCPGGIECSEWIIPSLAGGTTATLDAPIFVLAPTGAITATAALLSSTPTDANTANNTATVTLNQATVPIVAPLVVYKPTQLIPVVIQKLNPNIADSYIELELESLIEKTIYFGISNAMGQTVLTKELAIERGMNKATFDVSNLPQGLYFIQTNVGKGRNVPTKFIKM
jgi:subtilase family serine protease